jgi:hypothetical protein
MNGASGHRAHPRLDRLLVVVLIVRIDSKERFQGFLGVERRLHARPRRPVR